MTKFNVASIEILYVTSINTLAKKMHILPFKFGETSFFVLFVLRWNHHVTCGLLVTQSHHSGFTCIAVTRPASFCPIRKLGITVALKRNYGKLLAKSHWMALRKRFGRVGGRMVPKQAGFFSAKM